MHNSEVFFVGNLFSDFFEKDGKKDSTLLREFVSSTQIFPAVTFQESGNRFLDFFWNMRKQASEIFKTKLDMDFEEVCEKATNIGIFKPHLSISNEKPTQVPPNRETDTNYPVDNYGVFYEIAPALFEFWINRKVNAVK